MNQSALDSVKELYPGGLWQVKNIFSDNELIDLLDKINQEPDENWKFCGFEQYQQVDSPRLELRWVDNGLLDHIWGNLNELDFSRFGFKFKRVIIWKDFNGYTIADHSDGDHITGSMQIYLNDAPENLGTCFSDTCLPFIKNTGYIMDNKHKLSHYMLNPVPVGVERLSLYALFDYLED